MTFVAKPLSDLPKRQGRTSKYDASEASALLEIVSQDGQTATDDQSYEKRAEAQKHANAARRLLLHVLPDGKIARTRVTGSDADGWAWHIFLADAKAEKPAKKAAK